MSNEQPQNQKQAPKSAEHPAGLKASSSCAKCSLGWWLGAGVTLVVSLPLLGGSLWRPGVLFMPGDNVQIAEADAWLEGRLALPERQWDTALFQGRAYSHFPPMFTVAVSVVLPIFGGVPHWLLVLILIVPVPLLAFALFFRQSESPWWGTVLAIGLVGGTSLLPVLDKAMRGAAPYYVNHALATIGLLIVLNEYFGRRRMFVACAGLIVAALSRQLTLFYCIPLLAMARMSPKPQRNKIVLLSTVAMVIVIYGSLNYMKFGNPLESGYRLIYAGRSADDPLVRAVETHGLFSSHYVPQNLYYANVGFPQWQRVSVGGEFQYYLRPNHLGTGIWWTTPLLVMLFVDFKRIGRDPLRWPWLVSVGLVLAVLMCFHNTGFDQRGFNRFSLDYVPVLVALVVPGLCRGRRRWVALGMIAWSMIYFRVVLPLPHVRIW